MPYKNPEDRRRRFKERYASDPEFRARHNAAGATWVKGNRDARRAYEERYRQENRERLNAKARARDPEAKRAATARWRERNREENRRRDSEAKKAARARRDPVQREHIRADRFRRRGSRPDPTAREYMRVLDGDPCVYCGGVGDTIDHIDPLIAGGPSEWHNLAAACARCNTRKNDLPLLVALATRRFITTDLVAANLSS